MPANTVFLFTDKRILYCYNYQIAERNRQLRRWHTPQVKTVGEGVFKISFITKKEQTLGNYSMQRRE